MAAHQVINFIEIFGTFVTIGGLLNILCNLEFRHHVADFLASKAPSLRVRQVDLAFTRLAALFFDNTIFAFFGRTPFSGKAIARSALLSCVFFVVALTLALVATDSHVLSGLAPFFGIIVSSPGYFIIMLVVIFVIDYLSFLQTFYFIKYAARSRGVLEILFIAYFDVILSVNIFLFLFPVFMVAFDLGAVSIPHSGEIAIKFKPVTPGIRLPPPSSTGYEAIPSHDYEQLNRVLADLVEEQARLQGHQLLSSERYEYLGSLGTVSFTSEKSPNSQQFLPFFGSGDMRFVGLAFDDIPEFVGLRIPKISDYKKYNLKSSYTTLPLTLSFVVSSWDFDIQSLLQSLNGLYGWGFQESQLFQSTLPESLWHPTLLDVKLFALNEYIRSRITTTKDLEPSKTLLDFCDEDATLARNILERTCGQRVVMDLSPYTIDALIHLKQPSSFPIPFGAFFVSSFCVTIVFYMSLLVFLVLSSVLRLLIAVAPGVGRQVLDIPALRDNSVWAIFSIGGLVVALALSQFG